MRDSDHNHLSLKLAMDQTIRASFDEQVAQPDWGEIDLGMALFAEMTERFSRSEIASLEIDDRYIRREIAFSIYRTQFLRPDDQTEGDIALIEAIIAALIDPDAPLQLELKRKSRGKPLSYLDFERRMERERQIVERLSKEVAEGIKLESAVASISAEMGISRSTIFAMWRQRHVHDQNHVRAHRIEPQIAPLPMRSVVSIMLRSFVESVISRLGGLRSK